jgi:hypothetical protein
MSGLYRMATNSLSSDITEYLYVALHSPHIVLSVFFFFQTFPSMSKAEYHKGSPWWLFLDTEDLLAFKMPQTEVLHVVKSGLRGRHAISDPRPMYCPLNVLLRYSRRTGGAQCAGAPSCCSMHIDSRLLSRSCETKRVWSTFRYAVWLTRPSKYRRIKWSVEIAGHIILLGTCKGTLWSSCNLFSCLITISIITTELFSMQDGDLYDRCRVHLFFVCIGPTESLLYIMIKMSHSSVTWSRRASLQVIKLLFQTYSRHF